MLQTLFVALVLALLTPLAAHAETPEGMVLIPAGEFMMGSPPGEGADDEHPQHRVYVDAFYMDKYEVTVGQYKEFVRATGHRPLPDWVSQYSPGDNSPVVGISWEDAIAYAEWAGKRLPTEAEWEYACRAGKKTKYNVGKSIDHSDANYGGIYERDRWDKPVPVGSLAPNAWGLYEMHGNVWEWCSDWYDGGYYRNSQFENPKGPSSGWYRVMRGGSWSSYAGNLRSANRSGNTLGYMSSAMGFRCVQDVR